MLISKASVSSAIRPDAPEKRPKPSTESAAQKCSEAGQVSNQAAVNSLSVKITDAHSWICNDVLPAPPPV